MKHHHHPSGSVKFAKMAGGGNDFIVIDNRDEAIADGSLLAASVCTRRLSVGADGLILIENTSMADVRMIYFNADGSRGEFCGNGTRCVARYAFIEGIAGAHMSIETDSGIVPATVEDDRVTITVMSPASTTLKRPLELPADRIEGSFLRVGVPHYVILTSAEDFWTRDVVTVGRAIRNHPLLQPDGANVNFVRVKSRNAIDVRTYERGVEDETLACGSGVVASVSLTALSGLTDSTVSVLTRSGITFSVTFSRNGDTGDIENVQLSGDARVVFRSELTEESWSGFDPGWVRNPTSRSPRP